MNKTKGLKTALFLAVSAIFTANSAMAAGPNFDKTHPRRAEVNKRLNHQDNRIKKDVKNGALTKAQAHQLHEDDRQIRQEERTMARQNGGHITKQEQHALNQQENAVSMQIPKYVCIGRLWHYLGATEVRKHPGFRVALVGMRT